MAARRADLETSESILRKRSAHRTGPSSHRALQAGAEEGGCTSNRQPRDWPTETPFNLAEQWGLYRGRNPEKGLKFLPENNCQFRSLTKEEEERLLHCCSPYLQDLVTFAIHTGLRLGDMLNLKWEEVDIGQDGSRFLVQKTQRVLEVPLNDESARVIR